MKAQDLILKEKNLSGPVYHSTTVENAALIVRFGHFKFGNSHRSPSEKKLKPKEDYRYFMSVSRTRMNAIRKLSSMTSLQKYSGVTLVLDIGWFNKKHYIIRPVNWWAEHPNYYKVSEDEERIWSSEYEHPIDSIKEIHLMYNLRDENLKFNTKMTDNLVEYSQQRNIPLFIYGDQKSYYNMKKSDTVEWKDIRSDKDNRPDSVWGEAPEI